MAVNNATSKTQAPKAKPAAAPKAEKELRVYLKYGASFSHNGKRFEPETVYVVTESYGDWLLGLEAHGELKKFDEAGRTHKDLPVVYFTGSNKAEGTGGESAEDLAEIQKHMESGQGEDNQAGDSTESDNASVEL